MTPTRPIARLRQGNATQVAARTAGPLKLQAVLNRDLARYYALLDRELPALSVSEAALLLSLTRGLVLTGPVEQLPAVLAQLAAERGQDGGALVRKLRKLCPMALQALVDRSERYWSTDRPDDVELAERLILAGFRLK